MKKKAAKKPPAKKAVKGKPMDLAQVKMPNAAKGVMGKKY